MNRGIATCAEPTTYTYFTSVCMSLQNLLFSLAIMRPQWIVMQKCYPSSFLTLRTSDFRKTQILEFESFFKIILFCLYEALCSDSPCPNLIYHVEPVGRELQNLSNHKRNCLKSPVMQSPVPECAQDGRLTEIQIDRVISLLLGWRVRFLMRSKRILKGVHALNDVYKVLSEVISTTTSSSPSSSSPGTAVAALSTKVDPKDYANRNRMFDVICQLSGNQSKRNGAMSGIDTNIPYNDRVLVSHLIKEVLLLRAAFRRALFEDVVWRPFQNSSSNHHMKKEHLGNQSREGYWDFSASISAIFNTAAVNDYPPSSGFGSPKRKQSSYFPTASRSSSFRVGHQEQQQQQQQQQHMSGDDSDDSLNHKSSSTPHTSPAVAGPTGDLGRTQPVVRRASIPFQEFPQARSDVSKGDDKLGISLSETSDSVIQAQLASLRLQAMKKKLGVMAEGEDNGGDEEKEKDRDRVGRLKRSAVIRRAPVLPSKTSVSAPAVAKSSSLIEPVRPDGCRACIQLTVLHADRLMPAKKVRELASMILHYDLIFNFIEC